MRVWRITKASHAAEAFSGEGARRYAARWNEAGLALVYTSSSLSLAAMETFVHMEGQTAAGNLVFVEAELPVDLDVFEEDKKVLMARLGKGIRVVEEETTRRIGSDWVRSGASLVLPVPSFVVEGEWNVLVNPAHGDAAKIRLSKPQPFRFDIRMFKRRI